MQTPPSARYPVARSRSVWMLCGGAWTVGAVSVAAWLGVGSVLFAGKLLASLWLLASAFVLCRHLAALPTGSLGWNGTVWQWAPSGLDHPQADAAVHAVLQTSSLVLLRLSLAKGRGLWIWLDRRTEPAAWHAMRCALSAYARVSTQPGVSGGGLSA